MWGYFVPAIIRINYFSTSQVLIVSFVMLTITPLTALLLKSAKTTTEMVWGRMPPRAGLFPCPQRGHGHSPDDADGLCTVVLSRPLARLWRAPRYVAIRIFTGARLCGGIMALNTFFFCMLVAFIFWVATMGDKAKRLLSDGEECRIMAATAGASSALDKPERIESFDRVEGSN